jgi:hypothetical protein
MLDTPFVPCSCYTHPESAVSPSVALRELFYAIQHKLRKSLPMEGNIDVGAPAGLPTSLAFQSTAQQCHRNVSRL